MTWVLDYIFLGIAFIVIGIGVLAYVAFCMGIEELFQFILSGPKSAVEQKEPRDRAHRSETAERIGRHG
jgi:hypothetical protein